MLTMDYINHVCNSAIENMRKELQLFHAIDDGSKLVKPNYNSKGSEPRENIMEGSRESRGSKDRLGARNKIPEETKRDVDLTTEYVKQVCASTIDNMKKELGMFYAVVIDKRNRETQEKQSQDEHYPPEKLKQIAFNTKKKKKAKNTYPLEARSLFESFSNIEEKTKLLLETSHKQGTTNTDKISICCKDLESLNFAFKPYPVGSRVLGLCDEHSDLDIFLDVGGMFDGSQYQHPEDQEYITNRVAKMLRATKAWSQIIRITGARTPIIKAVHKSTQLNCDISFRNGLGYVNTNMIRSLMEQVPVFKPLVLILKHWCRITKLDQAFKSYSLTIMIMFYLQIRRVLPSVAVMRSFYRGKPILVCGWEVHYSQRPAVYSNLIPAPSLIHLLFGFFDYYGNVFKFDTEVVCPLMGRPILKTDFDCDALPNEMNTYKEMKKMVDAQHQEPLDDTAIELFRNKSAACVQDPFDLSHNLSKAVPLHTVKKFTSFCSTQADDLKQLINQQQDEA